MGFTLDESTFSHGINVGFGYPYFYGTGPAKIRGSAYMEGPTFIGQMFSFPWVTGTCMIGPQFNLDCYPPFDPFATVLGTNWSPHSLNVIGDAAFRDHISVSLGVWSGFGVFSQYIVYAQSIVYTPGVVIAGALVFGGTVASPGHILSAKKNFDIPHPSKEGWRLRHTCPEGPSNDVFIRGRVKDSSEIKLPEYWKNFVDIENITITLTPIGSTQNLRVDKWDSEKVYIQSEENSQIEYFYTIYAERIDGDRLVSEYPGLTPDDYPGDNSEYNINI